LDETRKPLVALYLTVEDNPDIDGAVYVYYDDFTVDLSSSAKQVVVGFFLQIYSANSYCYFPNT
jgi:hypothetical protein